MAHLLTDRGRWQRSDIKSCITSQSAAISFDECLYNLYTWGTNRPAIAMMFIRLSVCLSGTGVHCDHTMHLQRGFKFMVG